MKRLVNFLLFFHSVICVSAQIDIEKTVTQNQTIPVNWVDIITKGATWKVKTTIWIGNKSRKVYREHDADNLENSVPITYQFLSGFLTKMPMLIDTFETLPITYFPSENTFYFSYTLNSGDKSVIQKFPFKVLFLDSAFMVIEHLELTHFNYDIGKVLSDEEFAKANVKNYENIKYNSVSYDVVDKPKKRTQKYKEGLRPVELLSLK